MHQQINSNKLQPGLPEKTIERLTKYRRCLQMLIEEDQEYIYSHELAKMLHLTSVQVRRDIMLIGHSGTLRKGYDIAKLFFRIVEIIESCHNINIAIVGMGNLGNAILHYMQGKSPRIHISAAFDNNPQKIGKSFNGIHCHDFSQAREIIQEQKISIAVITTPASSAQSVCDELVHAGIKGILNYTTKPLHIPPHIYREEYDMITSLEKVAYYIKSD